MAWTGWSWTAEVRLNVDTVQSAGSVATNNPRNQQGAVNLDVPFLDPSEQDPSGMVMDNTDTNEFNAGGTEVWKLNVVMALISCWVAMTLTGWGTLTEDLTEDQNAANPTVGRWNMAMLGISQWLAIALYVWTLVAPRVFPDRDFS